MNTLKVAVIAELRALAMAAAGQDYDAEAHGDLLEPAADRLLNLLAQPFAFDPEQPRIAYGTGMLAGLLARTTAVEVDYVDGAHTDVVRFTDFTGHQWVARLVGECPR